MKQTEKEESYVEESRPKKVGIKTFFQISKINNNFIYESPTQWRTFKVPQGFDAPKTILHYDTQAPVATMLLRGSSQPQSQDYTSLQLTRVSSQAFFIYIIIIQNQRGTSG